MDDIPMGQRGEVGGHKDRKGEPQDLYKIGGQIDSGKKDRGLGGLVVAGIGI